jgi:hypothetical protein
VGEWNNPTPGAQVPFHESHEVSTADGCRKEDFARKIPHGKLETPHRGSFYSLYSFSSLPPRGGRSGWNNYSFYIISIIWPGFIFLILFIYFIFRGYTFGGARE